MKEASNKLLMTLAVFAVTISLVGIYTSFTSEKISLITGGATGSVNISINSSLGITMISSDINFTTSNPGDSRTSYEQDDLEGESCSADYLCGFNITNDGSVLMNITIQETENLFDSASFVNTKHLLYNTTHEELGYAAAAPGSGCSVGYPGGFGEGYWRALPRASAEVAVCALNFTDGSDAVRVDLNVTVPTDEPPGQKLGTITFLASEA
ncbi:MAG: hypothetical protein PHE43_04340 [Candidatus Nanoarchaeia archaeon]|nr:hypothetical protein [Candidatus Nanoarchaeia archaeon]